MNPSDIYMRAKELHVAAEVPRGVFVIRPVDDRAEAIPVDVVQNMFPDRQNDFVLSVGDDDVALIHQMPEGACGKDLEKVAASIEEALRVDGESTVFVGIGTLALHLRDLALAATEGVYEAGGLACNFMGRDFYRFYLSVWKERALILQMAAEAGIRVEGPGDLPRLRERLLESFRPELAFLRDLPTILETGHFVFVHGGVPSYEAMEELDAWRCMKNDDFMSQGYSFPKYCVVGHWPVTLYDPHIPSAAPLLERERHIASIDGGCVLKLDGQLNALVLPRTAGGAFSWYSYDGLPKATALDPQTAGGDSVNIRWGRNRVEVLERGAELSRCRHLESGRVLEVLTDYLYEDQGVLRCQDSTDYRPQIAAGDRLSVVRRLSDRALVKKNGATGWYFGRLA